MQCVVDYIYVCQLVRCEFPDFMESLLLVAITVSV